MNSTQHIDASVRTRNSYLAARVRITAASIAAAVTLAGCDFLDLTPQDGDTLDMVWRSAESTEAYLLGIYPYIPREYDLGESVWTGLSDEADISGHGPTPAMNRGEWDPSSKLVNYWHNYYKGIRSSFVFEANVDKCTELSEETIALYKGRAKFLRGYFYWKLLQQYGPFVLLESEVDTEGDWSTFARTPYDQCVAYICRMMDEAAEALPLESVLNTNGGHPSGMACMAIKAEVLLMAASPQWNGNTEYADFTNRDGTPLVDATYRPEKWEAAAEAAGDMIRAAEEESFVQLYRNDVFTDIEFNPYTSVRDAILQPFNCETIWVRTAKYNISETVEYMLSPSPGGMGVVGPTQRLVDAFYMRDGLGIDESPLYSETGFATEPHPAWTEDNLEKMRSGEVWGHRVGEHRMFANREARFYAAIMYNGRPIPQVDNYWRDLYSSEENSDGWGRVELYTHGRSGFYYGYYSETGYLVQKNIHPLSSVISNSTYGSRPHIFIRLARVHLDYIEALNECNPAHPDIRKYWDMIRSRAGLPSIFETHPQIAGDADAQRELILRERQVELCFENDRYFTTRRRWLAHLGGDGSDAGAAGDGRYGDGGPMWGLDIEAGESFADESFYRRTVFENRVFEKKYYIFPIPQSEIDKNPLMVQNPGW